MWREQRRCIRRHLEMCIVRWMHTNDRSHPFIWPVPLFLLFSSASQSLYLSRSPSPSVSVSSSFLSFPQHTHLCHLYLLLFYLFIYLFFTCRQSEGKTASSHNLQNVYDGSRCGRWELLSWTDTHTDRTHTLEMTEPLARLQHLTP